jgi:hypothetical protein
VDPLGSSALESKVVKMKNIKTLLEYKGEYYRNVPEACKELKLVHP